MGEESHNVLNRSESEALDDSRSSSGDRTQQCRMLGNRARTSDNVLQRDLLVLLIFRGSVWLSEVAIDFSERVSGKRVVVLCVAGVMVVTVEERELRQIQRDKGVRREQKETERRVDQQWR